MKATDADVLTEPQDCYVIWGEAPEQDWTEPTDGEERKRTNWGEQVSRPVEIEFNRDAADAYVLRSLHAAFTAMLGQVDEGGQVSILISRGKAPTEDEPSPPLTTGSFVIAEASGHRHIWEFRVQQRKAVV